MNSPGASLIDCGLAALAAVSGEQLTFGNLTITATVDRNVVRGREFVDQFKGGEAIEFSHLNMSRIEIRKEVLSESPVAGDCFIDGSSYRHRARAVINLDVVWVCWCVMSHFTPRGPKQNMQGAGGDDIGGAGGDSIQGA